MLWKLFFRGLLSVVLTSLSYANEGVWESLNAPGYVHRTDDIGIGYDDFGQRYIYLADSSADGTILRSSDDGNTWLSISPMEPCELEVSKSHANIVIIAEVTTYRCNIKVASTALNQPGEITWNTMNNGIPNRVDFITGLALDQSSIEDQDDLEFTAFISFRNPSEYHNNMVFRTTDGGAVWQSPNFLPYQSSVEDIKVCQAFPQNVIV